MNRRTPSWRTSSARATFSTASCVRTTWSKRSAAASSAWTKGFAKDEPVDVVVRPEDIDIVPVKDGMLTGTVTSITFKGMQYDVIVDFKRASSGSSRRPTARKSGSASASALCRTASTSCTRASIPDSTDYSSFSEEYDELSDAEYDPEAEEESSESREESADEE